MTVEILDMDAELFVMICYIYDAVLSWSLESVSSEQGRNEDALTDDLGFDTGEIVNALVDELEKLAIDPRETNCMNLNYQLSPTIVKAGSNFKSGRYYR